MVVLCMVSLTEAQFWKQFFEASANVSLSNYAEAAIEDSSMNQDVESSHAESETRSEESLYTSPSRAYEEEDDITITTPGPQRNRRSDDEDDPLLTSPSLPHNHSTPRMPGSATGKRRAKGNDDSLTKVSDVPSPYEKLRQEMRGGKTPAHGNAPITPGKRPPALPDMSMTPGSSPFDMPESTFKTGANKDAILHQGILGRTYRVAATPMTARRTQILDTAMSSPDEPEPQLRMEYFSSPMKPGYSVQTPGRKEAVERQRMERRRSSKGVQNDTRELDFGEATRGRAGYTARSMLDWASDDDEIPEMSPPKTIHFGLGGNPLIQTPGMLKLPVTLYTC
jgi:DASH complex subunit ASK1